MSFKQHALNTKAKVNTRNNLLRKLTNSRWGAHPATVLTTALALCFSTAEYACSSWGCSRHTGHVDIALNDTCRIITGCLKATPIPCLYALAGIAPPHIRRKVAANADRCLQEDDPRHPLHGQRPVKHRLTSRNSFLDSTEALNTSKQDARTTLWVEEWNALGERSTEWRDRVDHSKWTFGQRHRRALVHLEELESAESAKRTLSGYDENVEALPYRCMWLWGETDYVSSYDMWWCPQLHVDRPGFSNPCRCQLCQTLGGINLTVDIEYSTKKNVAFVIFSPTASSIVPWQIFKLRFIDGDARSTPSQTPVSVTDSGNPGAVGIPHSPRPPCDMENLLRAQIAMRKVHP